MKWNENKTAIILFCWIVRFSIDFWNESFSIIISRDDCTIDIFQLELKLNYKCDLRLLWCGLRMFDVKLKWEGDEPTLCDGVGDDVSRHFNDSVQKQIQINVDNNVNTFQNILRIC